MHACTVSLSLLCWSCEGFLSAGAGRNVSRPVFSRLSGCTPSDSSQFARHCRIHDHFQLLLSSFLSGFSNFHVLRINMTNSSSAYEHCRSSASQGPNAVSPFAENSPACSIITLATNAGAWTLLEFDLNFLVDHVCPSGGVVFNKVNWVKPAHAQIAPGHHRRSRCP